MVTLTYNESKEEGKDQEITPDPGYHKEYDKTQEYITILEGLNMFNRTNLTLNSDMDPDT